MFFRFLCLSDEESTPLPPAAALRSETLQILKTVIIYPDVTFKDYLSTLRNNNPVGADETSVEVRSEQEEQKNWIF